MTKSTIEKPEPDTVADSVAVEQNASDEAETMKCEEEQQSVRIDPEFERLLTPLAEEERKQLEASLQKEGCRDALVVWNNILIDGHNRYAICKRLNIKYDLIERYFADRAEAAIWIIKNQMGRRNLTTWQKAQLALKLKPIYEELGRQNMAAGGGDRKSTDYKGNLQSGCTDLSNPILSVDSTEQAAREVGISRTTLNHAEYIVKHQEQNPTLVKELDKNTLTVDKAYNTLKKVAKDENAHPKVRQIRPNNINLKPGKKTFKGFLSVNEILAIPGTNRFVVECALQISKSNRDNDQAEVNRVIGDMTLAVQK